MAKGRIQKALSGFYYVYDDGKIYQTRARGVFRNQNITPLVGDIVEYKSETEKEGTIWDIDARKNALQRPPVANVDVGFIIMSVVEPNFSFQLLDQFLVHLEHHKIEPVIIITKTDLVSDEETNQLKNDMAYYDMMSYPIFYSSMQEWSEEEIASLTEIVDGKLSLFMGQSGTGKSTLMNTLSSDLDLETGEISKALGRGRHTTRHVELLPIFGGLIADTPGFSSLTFVDITPEELPKLYRDFDSVSDQCKFRGCVHKDEPKCAVKALLEEGRIPQKRYDTYLAFLEEIVNQKPKY